jgi:dihydrofolate synthase/folylpolyglutamate synthase
VNIRNLQEANEALQSYADRDPKHIGRNYTLKRVFPLMEAAGNPQDRLKVIHIAGTSGKTSTAYFMAALLKATGKKVGLTVSPHVDSVTERIQINGVPLDEAVFCKELEAFMDVVERSGQHPSYFELLYAFALWIFDRQDVDYAVLETGVGGLYDATNVAGRPDKVCVITDIGFDHMHILGNTLTKIATQKSGIIHEDNTVFMYEQGDEVMQVMHKTAAKQHATLHLIEQPATGLQTAADYQRRNWNLAYQVYLYLKDRDDLQSLTSQVLAKTQTITVPGRMDIREVRGKTLVMDGAHNAQKMTAFISSFKKLYPGVKPAVLLSLKHNKDDEGIAPLLAPFASRIIVTAFDTAQDSQIRSMNPRTLAASLREAGAQNLEVIADHDQATEVLLASPEEVCVITGSFYLLSQIRHNKNLV